MQNQQYAPATSGRTIKRARQFFKLAMRDKIITENPFADVKASGQTNKERQFHIDCETIANVIDAAPDHEWRLIIALSRFGGLRCPSEHLVHPSSKRANGGRAFQRCLHTPAT